MIPGAQVSRPLRAGTQKPCLSAWQETDGLQGGGCKTGTAGENGRTVDNQITANFSLVPSESTDKEREGYRRKTNC